MAPRKGKLRDLRTEQQNSASAGLDTLSALEIARVINHEDHKVAAAVERALPQIAQAIDAIADAIRSGGRLIYVGAGTSGRLAALDAAECPPTFNTDPKTVQYVIAGGNKALGHAAEYSEDSGSSGRKDIAKRKPGKKDVVVGVAASGRTPYTLGALEHARKKGAKTVAVVCNRGSQMGALADIEIVHRRRPGSRFRFHAHEGRFCTEDGPEPANYRSHGPSWIYLWQPHGECPYQES